MCNQVRLEEIVLTRKSLPPQLSPINESRHNVIFHRIPASNRHGYDAAPSEGVLICDGVVKVSKEEWGVGELGLRG